MDENLFDRIDIEKSNTQVPDGMAENPLEVGPAYEQSIREAGGIDLQVLGVGTDGHWFQRTHLQPEIDHPGQDPDQANH